MGIDGEERGLEPLIANHALDGGAGLTFIEEDRLRIGNPPAIAYVGVDANRGGLTARIGPGQEDPLVRFHAHHVGGGQIRATPGS